MSLSSPRWEHPHECIVPPVIVMIESADYMYCDQNPDNSRASEVTVKIIQRRLKPIPGNVKSMFNRCPCRSVVEARNT